MNNHMADRWKLYSNKVSFPYVRQVGVSGDVVRFEQGEEEQFCQFLRSKNSAFLWTDSEDLQLMSNLYQMRIKVITTKSDDDFNPAVNWIGPDQEMNEYKLLPEGIVPEMALIYYDEVHYNLVISKDSVLAKVGTLYKQMNDEEEDMLIDEEQEDESSQHKLEVLSIKYKESEETVRKLYRKINQLEALIILKKFLY